MATILYGRNRRARALCAACEETARFARLTLLVPTHYLMSDRGSSSDDGGTATSEEAAGRGAPRGGARRRHPRVRAAAVPLRRHGRDRPRGRHRRADDLPPLLL